MTSINLTPKQQIFAQEYIITSNASLPLLIILVLTMI